MSNWIVFYNKNTDEELSRISFDGLFPGEIQNTKELLSYENNIKTEDIGIKKV